MGTVNKISINIQLRQPMATCMYDSQPPHSIYTPIGRVIDDSTCDLYYLKTSPPLSSPPPILSFSSLSFSDAMSFSVLSFSVVSFSALGRWKQCSCLWLTLPQYLQGS